MHTSYGPGNCHYGLNQSNLVKFFGPTKAEEIIKEEKKNGKKRASKKAGRNSSQTTK